MNIAKTCERCGHDLARFESTNDMLKLCVNPQCKESGQHTLKIVVPIEDATPAACVECKDEKRRYAGESAAVDICGNIECPLLGKLMRSSSRLSL